MSSHLPEKLLVLDRAAELRAAGAPWPTVATELKLPVEELRSLRAAHASAYNRLARRAADEFRRDTMQETLARLRRLLQSENEGVAIVAAGTVVRYELARMRQDARRERPERPARSSCVEIRESPRWRNDPPPPPSRPTPTPEPACDSQCDSGPGEWCDRRCDTSAAVPEAPGKEEVKHPPVGQEKAMPSDVPMGGVTPAPTPPAAEQPAAPPRRRTTRVDAIRRRKWLPAGLI
jgi:hypothetical protein